MYWTPFNPFDVLFLLTGVRTIGVITKVIYHLLNLIPFFSLILSRHNLCSNFVCFILHVETTAGYNGQRYRCTKSLTRKSDSSTTWLRWGCQSQSGGEHKVNEGSSEYLINICMIVNSSSSSSFIIALKNS